MSLFTQNAVTTVDRPVYMANPESVTAPAALAHPVLRLPKAPVVFVVAILAATLLMLPAEFLESGTEDHLLMVWLAVWTVAFAVLSVLATPITLWAQDQMTAFAAWQVARQQAAEDRKLWAVALSDARVMNDLSCALSAE